MQEIGSFEARTHFSDLLRRVEAGEEFIITNRGKPVAMLTAPKNNQKNSDLPALLEEIAAFRAEITKRGPVLNPGETINDLAREGLKW